MFFGYLSIKYTSRISSIGYFILFIWYCPGSAFLYSFYDWTQWENLYSYVRQLSLRLNIVRIENYCGADHIF